MMRIKITNLVKEFIFKSKCGLRDNHWEAAIYPLFTVFMQLTSQLMNSTCKVTALGICAKDKVIWAVGKIANNRT
uniref:Uncharacterized protein n=1 Tax=Arundo donax TaxID=35708 RepID=A0A0A9CHD9_ARUDO